MTTCSSWLNPAMRIFRRKLKTINRIGFNQKNPVAKFFVLKFTSQSVKNQPSTEMKSAIVLAVIMGVAAAGLVGGWHEMSANSDEARKVALIAELRVNEMSNDVFHKKTTRILSVRSKVVAGILYEVVLEVGSTGCPKGSDVSNCVVAEVRKLVTIDHRHHHDQFCVTIKSQTSFFFHHKKRWKKRVKVFSP